MQHYLPAFHLRGFSHDSDRLMRQAFRSRRARLVFRNLDAAHVYNWIVRLDEVAVSPYFYDTLFGATFDRALTSIESASAQYFYRLSEMPVGSEIALDKDETRKLLAYFASLYMRSPSHIASGESHEFARHIISKKGSKDAIEKATHNVLLGTTKLRADAVTVVDGGEGVEHVLPILNACLWDEDSGTLTSLVKPNRVVRIDLGIKHPSDRQEPLVVQALHDESYVADVARKLLEGSSKKWCVAPVPPEMEHLRPYC